jgi:hypothetical protein
MRLESVELIGVQPALLLQAVCPASTINAGKLETDNQYSQLTVRNGQGGFFTLSSGSAEVFCERLRVRRGQRLGTCCELQS